MDTFEHANDIPAEPRKGAILILVAVLMTVVLAFVAFSVDVGYIALTKTQLQAAADSAALAAANDLAKSWGLGASLSSEKAQLVARESAMIVAAAHRTGDGNCVYLNRERDVQLGQYGWDKATQHWFFQANATPPSSAKVTIRRFTSDDPNDHPISLFFAPVIGHKSSNLNVTATAAIRAGVGFQPTKKYPNVPILPFTLDVNTWSALVEASLGGAGQQGGFPDGYGYGSTEHTVTPKRDGIPEVNLYPSTEKTLPSGNRGTLNLGASNSSTADISRQILEGISQVDIEKFGRELRTDDGPLESSGDPGISAGFKDELAKIVGEERAIPIFDRVSGSGSTSVYRVIKFVGVRIMVVDFTGHDKLVIIQPSTLIHDTVIPGKEALMVDSILAKPVLIQ